MITRSLNLLLLTRQLTVEQYLNKGKDRFRILVPSILKSSNIFLLNQFGHCINMCIKFKCLLTIIFCLFLISYSTRMLLWMYIIQIVSWLTHLLVGMAIRLWPLIKLVLHVRFQCFNKFQPYFRQYFCQVYFTIHYT